MCDGLCLDQNIIINTKHWSERAKKSDSWQCKKTQSRFSYYLSSNKIKGDVACSRHGCCCPPLEGTFHKVASSWRVAFCILACGKVLACKWDAYKLDACKWDVSWLVCNK